MLLFLCGLKASLFEKCEYNVIAFTMSRPDCFATDRKRVGELIDAWAETATSNRGTSDRRKGDGNFDLHNFWPELLVHSEGLGFP